MNRARWTVQYHQRVLATDPIAYWIEDEKQGAVAYDRVSGRAAGAQNGTHVGATLGQPGIGDGRTSPLYDGANDYTNVGTAPFLAAFPGPEGSLMMWALPDASTFNDAVTTRLWASSDAVGANRLFFAHVGNNADFQMDYRAGGVGVSGLIPVGVQPTAFQCLLMTWSAANDRVRYYLNGASGAPEDNGLGVWAAQPIRAIIGATSAAPANPYNGLLGHCAVWNRELSPAEIADLAVRE